MRAKVVDTHGKIHEIIYTTSDFSKDSLWVTEQFINQLKSGEWFQTTEGDFLSPVHIVRILP